MIFEPVTRVEHEAGLIIQTRPEKPRADVRTEEDQAFNRALVCGRLPPQAVVEVLNTIPCDNPDDGEFVQIEADLDRRVPKGWIHNKSRLVPELLRVACKTAGVPVDGSALLEDASRDLLL